MAFDTITNVYLMWTLKMYNCFLTNALMKGRVDRLKRVWLLYTEACGSSAVLWAVAWLVWALQRRWLTGWVCQCSGDICKCWISVRIPSAPAQSDWRRNPEANLKSLLLQRRFLRTWGRQYIRYIDNTTIKVKLNSVKWHLLTLLI